MVETQKTVSEIYTLLADNATGAISPRDLRDSFASWRPGHGQLYVAAADSGAVSFTDATTYVEVVAPTWTLSSGAYLFDQSDGNGRLTYTGVANAVAIVNVAVSMTSNASNEVTDWRLGKNGTSDVASEIDRKIGTGSDIGAMATQLITTVEQGDHLSLFVRNEDWTANETITINVANMIAWTIPAA